MPLSERLSGRSLRAGELLNTNTLVKRWDILSIKKLQFIELYRTLIGYSITENYPGFHESTRRNANEIVKKYRERLNLNLPFFIILNNPKMSIIFSKKSS